MVDTVHPRNDPSGSPFFIGRPITNQQNKNRSQIRRKIVHTPQSHRKIKPERVGASLSYLSSARHYAGIHRCHLRQSHERGGRSLHTRTYSCMQLLLSSSRLGKIRQCVNLHDFFFAVVVPALQRDDPLFWCRLRSVSRVEKARPEDSNHGA